MPTSLDDDFDRFRPLRAATFVLTALGMMTFAVSRLNWSNTSLLELTVPPIASARYCTMPSQLRHWWPF